MERAQIDAQLAQAAECFRRGELETAESLYAQAFEEYQRHNFPEGSLAITFNRLLVALERGERAQVHNHLESIASQLGDVPSTPWVSELCENLIRLLGQPIPGILQSTIDETVMAARMRIEEPQSAMTSDLDASAFQNPMPFEALCPGDAALAVMASMLSPSAPEWLREVRRSIGPSVTLPQPILRQLDEPSNSPEQQYQRLVDAFDWAVGTSPYGAAAIQMELAQLESKPLHQRLSFAVDSPLERRALDGCLLHTRVAKALDVVGGAEELMRGQWLAVRKLANDWLHQAGTRIARGGRQRYDAERRAELVLCLAQAELSISPASSFATARERGIQKALDLLAESVEQAELHGIDRALLSARVLKMGALCAEMALQTDRARRLYEEALQAALPGFSFKADFFARSRVLEELFDTLPEGAFVVAVEALLGICRIDKSTAALEQGDQILASCRSRIRHDVFSRLQFHMALCRVLLGEPESGIRALGVASILNQSEPLALAHCLTGFERLRPAIAEHLSTSTAIDQFDWALRCALAAPKSAMRSAVAMAAGMAYALEGEGLSPADCSSALLKAASALAETGRGMGGGEWDVYLLYFDMFRTYSAEAAAAHLIKAPGIFGSVANEISAAICDALRRQKAVLEWLPEETGLQKLDLDWARRVIKSQSLASLELPLQVAGSCETAAVRAARGLAPGEIRVAFTVFPQWTAVHLSGLDLPCKGYALELTSAQLDDVICELLSALSESRLQEAALRSNQLFDALCAPYFVDLHGVRLVTFVPDGPLLKLPFGVLGRGQTLCDIFDMAVALEAQPLLPGPGPTPLARCAILGDADANTLDFGTLIYPEAFEEIRFFQPSEVEDDEQLREACNDQHLVVLFGDWIEQNGEPHYMLHHRPVPVRKLAECLALGGVSCAIVMGPLQGELGRRAIRHLLSGVRTAVLACHRAVENHQPLTMRFLPGISHKRELMEFYAIFGGSRRGAAQTGSEIDFWSSFELYVAAE